MILVPSSGERPAASFCRLFQSKAILSAFSTASAPPSTKNRCGSAGSPTTRLNVSTNSAYWVVYMSGLAGLFTATWASSVMNAGSSTMPGGFSPSGAEAKNVYMSR
jgi:hypothetical protein